MYGNEERIKTLVGALFPIAIGYAGVWLLQICGLYACKGRFRMKKVLLVCILIALVLVPVVAATEGASKSSFAVGLGLGSGLSITGQYRMDKFDIVGNLGFGYFSGYLSFDASVNYKVAEFSIEKADFDVTVGGGGYVDFPLHSGWSLGLAAFAPVSLIYHLNSNDVPMDFYARLALGAWILPNLHLSPLQNERSS